MIIHLLLSAKEIEKLRAISQQSYKKEFSGKIACEPGETVPESAMVPPTDEEIKEVVKKMLTGK